MYLCNACGKSFTWLSNLKRHIRDSCKNSGPPAKKPRFEDSSSAGPSSSSGPYTPRNEEIVCSCCNKILPPNAQVPHFRSLNHRNNACLDYIPGVQLLRSAFRNRIVSYRIANETGCTDFNRFFEAIRTNFINLLQEMVEIHRAVKVNMEMFARYVIQTQGGEENSDVKSFNTSNQIIDCSTDLNQAFDTFVDVMLNQTSEFQESDSGWALQSIMYAEVNINKYRVVPNCESSSTIPCLTDEKCARDGILQ